MMTNVPPSDAQRDAIRDEIRAELHQEAKRKRMRNCAGCLVVSFLLVAVPVIVVAVMVAKTGLVQVPVFSARVYRPTAPLREVLPIVGSTTEELIKTAIANAKFDPATSTAAVTITEQQLTTVVREALVGMRSQLPFELKEPQIAVQPDMMELFAKTTKDGNDVPVRIRLVPSVTADGLSIETKELIIGGFEAPAFLTGIMSTAMNRALADSLGSFAGGGAVTDVSLSVAKVKVTVVVPKKP